MSSVGHVSLVGSFPNATIAALNVVPRALDIRDVILPFEIFFR